MKITIIGIGLIGGSLALECKKLNHHVIGVDANPEHEKIALELNLVDEILDLDTAISKSDMIILAIPVHHIETLLPTVLDTINHEVIVIDAGSTKGAICNAVRNHPRRGRFVAAHPLAGTEFSGPHAAHLDLFRGKNNLLCERTFSDPDALETTLELFDAMGFNHLFMEADEHDRHLAYVSHLSHVTSFILGLTVLDIEKDEKQIHNLAGTGFQSTARLAKSSPQTWSAIFDKNSKHLVDSIDSYIGYLTEFRNAVNDHDKEKAINMMTRANDIERVLKSIEKK